MSTQNISHNTSCVAAATQILGDKWTPLIIGALHQESFRFCKIQEIVGGVNPRTLSARLTQLEERGVIEKYIREGAPYAYYKLTDKGEDLFPIISSMTQWGEKYAHATPHN